MSEKEKTHVVQVTPEIHKRLKEQSKKTGMRITFIVNQALEARLDILESEQEKFTQE